MSDVFAQGDWAKTVPTSTWRSAFLGYGSMAVFVAFFGYWAATAPLAGAAIAPGVVAASGQNLKIQHLEGGTVTAVLVKEGERVKLGDTLLTLDPTVLQSQLDRFIKLEAALKAKQARLSAERDGKENLVFPNDVIALTEKAGLASVINEQQGEFAARLNRHRNELSILGERVSQMQESVVGMEARKKASDEQLKIVKSETQRKLKLLDQGLTARDQYTQLLRSQADLLGQVSSTESQISSAKNQINEAREQIERAKSQRIEDALKELSDASNKLSDGEEQIKAARSMLERTIIKAPADGIIVSLKVNSPGIVLRPGEPVLELLPTTSDLVIEARIDPRSIDTVKVGQEARLRFTALNSTTTPEVSASVTYISADRLVDPATNQPYFQARLRITDNLPEEISRGQIYPGMPVETYISTGDRTFAEYLVKPLTDSFSRSFREN
jgi:HlyD family type I secretion membrane fusion protein